MKSIHITPPVQLALVASTVTAVGVAVAAQLPEIRRYLKVRSMD